MSNGKPVGCSGLSRDVLWLVLLRLIRLLLERLESGNRDEDSPKLFSLDELEKAIV